MGPELFDNLQYFGAYVVARYPLKSLRFSSDSWCHAKVQNQNHLVTSPLIQERSYGVMCEKQQIISLVCSYHEKR